MNKVKTIEEIFRKTTDVASHAQVAIKVMNLLKNEYVSIDEIDEILSRDKGFTARFLRIANSPYYGMRSKVRTLKDALILIGLDTAKSLILATSARYLYRYFGDFEQRLWEHSLGVGLCSSLLAVTIRSVTPELALACGILHDLGKVFINNAMPEIYPKIYDKILKVDKSSVEIEDEFLGLNHTEIGLYVAEQWNYPEEIARAIQYHHTYPYPKPEERVYRDICNIIRISNQICLELGIGFKKERIQEIAYEEIKLDKESIEDMKKIFFKEFNEQKKFLLE